MEPKTLHRQGTVRNAKRLILCTLLRGNQHVSVFVCVCTHDPHGSVYVLVISASSVHFHARCFAVRCCDRRGDFVIVSCSRGYCGFLLL